MSAAIERKPGARILDVTEDEYFADPCAVPSLSQSTAHTLLTRSPLHAWTAHPKLNPQPVEIDEPTTARDEGSILHALLMGKGVELDIIKADNYRTRSAQELRDAARAAGRMPVLECRHVELLEAAKHVRASFSELRVVFGDEHELAAYLHLSLVTVSPRLRPLAEKGLVLDSGFKRAGSSGRRSIVWKIRTVPRQGVLAI